MRLSVILAPVKRFLSWRWTQRALLLLGGICAGITGTFYAGGLYAKHQEEKKVEALVIPREFPTFSLRPLTNSNISLVTAWSTGSIKYRLSIPYPTFYLVKKQSANEGQINMEFYDEHGFKVTTINVPMGQFQQTIDQSGLAVRLEANASASLPRENYQQIATWSPSWNLTSEAKARQADQERLKELSGLRKEMGSVAGIKMVDEQIRQLKKEIDETYGMTPHQTAIELLESLPTIESPRPTKSRSFEEAMAELDTMKPVSTSPTQLKAIYDDLKSLPDVTPSNPDTVSVKAPTKEEDGTGESTAPLLDRN